LTDARWARREPLLLSTASRSVRPELSIAIIKISSRRAIDTAKDLREAALANTAPVV
jgi:hypothetical protein